MNSNEIDNTDLHDLMRQKSPIAVIGIAGLFPDSKDIEEYWDNIINEVDTIKDVPVSRWKIEDYYDPDPGAPDKTYCKRGGFIPDVDFNPMDFGLPPNILEVTDVSQLLALVVARQVLEDAGYGEESGYNRENIGITLGVGGGQKLITPLTTRLQYPIWKRVLTNSGISEEDADEIIEKIKKAYIGWEENSFPGMLGNVIAGRVANRLNLGGTNCVLDAACASSLAAMNMAVSDLLEYRSEIMITGGIDTDNSPFMYLSFSKTPAFTPDDTIRPFDIDSKGMLIGEGLGMVALKRLEDAERDQDRIYAVIKGIGTSSDGRFKSIYAPRPEGQVKALEQAYAKAGFPPQTVELVEAHGTGTAAGDIAEFTALKTVFESDNHRKQYIALGSVKSQIGHAKAAAGAAGFIKAALALYHRILPATINVKQPLPKMEIENSPFYINSETRPWFPSLNGYPRRAGVSSFGFGGTNFHAVLEEYTRNKDRLRKHNTLHAVVISDSTPEALLEKCRTIHKDLISDNGHQAFFNLVTQNGIAHIPASDARLGFICGSLAQAVNAADLAVKGLESQSEEAWERPEGLYYRSQGLDTRGRVVALFPGQGSQYINMGRQLAINFPAVMDSFVRMDRLFAANDRSILTEAVFPIPVFSKAEKAAGNQALQKTEVAQPAIGALSAGMYTIFKDAGFIPDYTAGHSFGELTALYVSGVLSAKDFYFLAKERGQAMAAPGDDDFDSGAMLAVIGDIETLEEDIKAFSDIVIANLNSGRQAVVAGPKKEIKTAESDLKARGYSVIPLQVSAAFHTSLVEHARKPFAKALESVRFNRPEIAIFSNSIGGPYPKDPEKISKILENHILSPVLFKDEIENIYQAGGRIFIEFGPKNVLTKLVGAILANRPHTAIALNTGKGCSDMELRRAAVKMCVAGLDISEIDPCRKMMATPSDKKPGLMNITLNGSNYVSEKTRKIFEDSLNDGFKVRQAEPEVVTKTIPTIEKNIEQFFEHQDETLKVHSQYLVGIKEYTGLFYDLMRQQHDLLREQPGLKFPEGVERSMEMFHAHQGETLKVHAQYLNNQTVCVREALGLIKQKVTGEPFDGWPHEAEQELGVDLIFASKGIKKTRETHAAVPAPTPVMPEKVEAAPAPVEKRMAAPATPPPCAASTAPSADIETLKTVMLEIVSEKTGYPSEMLELDMDMEADLGIDSIKRVEILAGFTEQFPDLPEANPEELAELKTLGEVIDKYRLLAQPAAETPAASCRPETKSDMPCIHKLTKVMLEVVSEKTGYPSEMLELDMDMEADLGIDSIKRVEILAGIQERFPQLPEVPGDELAGLKTLGEVAERMAAAADSGPATPAQAKKAAAQVANNGAKRSIAVVKRLPAPDVLEFNVREDEVCLITDDGTRMTSLLSEALLKKGFNVVVISYPEAIVKQRPKLSEGIARVILEDMSEESLEAVIAHIFKRFANIGGFIHLNPPVSKKSRESVIFPEKEKDILLSVFLAAKHLKKHLTAGAAAGRRFFMTACRLDGKLGISGKGFGLVSGGLCGLIKTLNLEWDNVFARIVDLGPDKTPADSASIIINELFDPDGRIVETAYGPEGRVTLKALEAEGAYEEKNDQIDSSSVFLVAGGAKGVTAACVAELAAAHKCRFILLGRSEYQGGNEPDWATGINDPAELKKAIMNQLKQSNEKPTPKVVDKKFKSILSNRDISRTLNRIRKTGSPAEYICADVIDRRTLKKKLASVVEKLGPVTGIIHGAGVLADRR
ncbi:MAG: beta-ketoacyl synthase N-terminal-like domain-containing protein, partial [Desulfobacterales bacterium]